MWGSASACRTSARRPQTLSLLFLAAAFALLILAPAASALKTHVYTGASFGPEGSSAGGAFENAQGIAVDQVSGNVYVHDAGAGKLYKFDSSGEPLDFSLTGENFIEGVGGAGAGENEIAVAPAGSSGGTAGDIYLAWGTAVKIYDASGEFLGELTTDGETCGVATNPAGRVFVSTYPEKVTEFTPSADPATNSDKSGESSAELPTICNVGADGLGNVYAAKYSGEIVKLEGLADSSASLVDPSAATLAIDPSSNDLYANRGNAIAQYSAAGNLLDTFGSAQLSASESRGVAVSSSGAKVYARDSGGKVAIFKAAAVPTVTATSAASLTATSAILTGSVDPDGVAVSDCHFEYTDRADFLANGFANATDAPCTPVPGSGSGDVAVSAAISGLEDDTAYDFRLVATNANGTTNGQAQSFTTVAVASTDPATTIHHTNAILNGHLDPDQDPAIDDCYFEWGTDTTYGGGTVDCAQGDSFAVPANVSAPLGGLTPGTEIHFRLHVSTTSHGDFTGLDRSFTLTPFPIVAEELAVFGPDGTSATAFSTLARLAVEAGHKLYAFDKGVPGIYGFGISNSPTYTQLAGFAPLATSYAGGGGFRPILAVDNTALSSAGNIYSLDSSGFGGQRLYGYDATGVPLGGFPVDPAKNPGSIGGICGTAVDSSGDIWISSHSAKRILQYTSAGVYQGFVDVSAQAGPDGPCEIAFDTATDDLYVAMDDGGVWKYTAASGYSSAAVTEIDSGVAQGLAVDPSTGILYVAHPSGVISEYEATGTHIGDFDTEILNDSEPYGGIAVDASTHDLYVVDRADNKIHVFGPGSVQKSPTLTPEEASAIAGSTATLNAKVDPEGFAVTDCHFEYTTEADFKANGFTNAANAPCAQDPGAGSGDVAVSADLTGLNPAATYRFRIVASNANGTAAGPAQSFTALGPTTRSLIAFEVNEDSAVLGAEVNPNTKPTTFHFEYTTEADFQANGFANATHTPESESIGSGSDYVKASQPIQGLAPNTTYRFRVLATNADATSASSEGTFVTLASDVCANSEFRTGAGSRLPDCRAYEQVSPVLKNGSNVDREQNAVQASASGDRFIYADYSGLPTTGGFADFPSFVASRGVSDWSSNGMLPLVEPGIDVDSKGWSEDLSSFASEAVPGGGIFRIYLGDTATGTWQQVANGDVQLASFDPSDSHHLTLESTQALTPGAIDGKPNLYDLDHETLTLAGRVPAFPATSCDDAGGPACVVPAAGSFAGPYNWGGNAAPSGFGGILTIGGALTNYYVKDTISSDGSKVFFTEGETGRLYLREDNTRTVQISASQASAPDPNGHKPAAYVAATPDGSKVFFLSCEKLTDDSTAVSTSADSCTEKEGAPPQAVQGQDLYAYDTESGDLSDLSADASAGPQGADVRGLLGVSADGADVYFAAHGVLATGATAGEDNLYLSQDGQISFIATLDGSGDSNNWRSYFGFSAQQGKTSLVAADGALLISSRTQLTPYDNAGKLELYRYDPSEAAAGLACVSCTPTGIAPIGDAQLQSKRFTALGASSGHIFLTRNLSADGNRVFFDSVDALVPGDVNGVKDVYEWEAAGAGSCGQQSSAYSTQDHGCIYLLSSGVDTFPSRFGDASASGDDVFILTGEQLVPQDKDALVDAYDVRVGGGLASQHRVTSPPCDVNAGACEGATTSSPETTGAGTAVFQGPGNKSKPQGKSCPKGKRKTRRGGKTRCVKAHKRKAKANNKRNASKNRRASR